MTEARQFLEELTITPELRAFLRAELAIAMTFDGPSGEPWSALAIEKEIKDSKTNPGSASDDTILRFRDGTGQRARPAALIGIAGFLLEFDYISKGDLEHYSQRGYSRAASALAQVYASDQRPVSADLGTSILGEYRDYRIWGNRRLMATTIVLASPDGGRSLTATEHRAVFVIAELEWFMEETDNLHPSSFHEIPALLQLDETQQDSQSTARGVGVATPELAFLAIGHGETAVRSLITVTEIHRSGEDVCGLRGLRAAEWVGIVDGQVALPQDSGASAILRKFFARLELYPQGIVAEPMPIIVRERMDALDDGEGRGRLGFMGTASQTMKTKEELIVAAAELDTDIDAALLDCKDATERLILAIEIMRVDKALAALSDGADINAEHPGLGLPMIHAAAALGMRDVVRGMINNEKCDLTVRDRFGRLASSCADNCAEDFLLRDELIAAQTAQFRTSRLDPRRPTVPGYGGYKLEPEPDR